MIVIMLKKVATHELEYMCEAGVNIWDFEMYDKKNYSN
jgi:hypothetical protein